MRSVSLGFAFAAVVLSPPACRNPFTDDSVILAVSGLSAPSVILKGAAATVILGVSVSGCESFAQVTQTRVKSGILLTALGANPAVGNENLSCPAVITVEQHSVVIDQALDRSFTVFVRQPSGGTPLRADISVVDTID